MRFWLVFVVLPVFQIQTAQAATPKELLGKSVTVRWSETREQGPMDGTRSRQASRNGRFIVYVSTAGRVFNRLSYAQSANYSSSDQIAGGGSDGFENRAVKFQGQSLSIFTSMQGGVRAITVEFGAGY